MRTPSTQPGNSGFKKYSATIQSITIAVSSQTAAGVFFHGLGEKPKKVKATNLTDPQGTYAGGVTEAFLASADAATVEVATQNFNAYTGGIGTNFLLEAWA